MTGIAAGMMIMLLMIFLLYLVIIGIVVANYVINSYGIYKLASRRQIDNPWMAWVPVLKNWTIGALAEQYDTRREQNRPWKKVLIVLAIVNIAGVVVVQIVSIIVSLVASFVGTTSVIQGNETITMTASVGFMMIFMILLTMIVSMAEMAFLYCQIVCIFKIFESTVPEKAFKYIILYLLVPLAGGICLLRCKDKGYPEPITQELEEQELDEEV